MAKVRKDEKGLFIITNGGKYRPEVSRYTYGQVWDNVTLITKRWPTTAEEGQTLKARHIAQSCRARVVNMQGKKEIWSLDEEIRS